MTAAVMAREVEVGWRDLAALVAEHDGLPGYSPTAGRAYLVLDGVLVWADCARVRLDPAVEGAGAIAAARLQAIAAADYDCDAAWLAGLSDEHRAHELAWRRQQADVPDPQPWQIDAYCDRHGIGGAR